MNQNQWQIENDYIINQMFNSLMMKTKKSNNSKLPLLVEFFITNQCNQKCEYCYLIKENNQELYPKELLNSKNILKNLTLILKYFNEKEYYPQAYELFSGEIWNTKFGLDILTIFLQHIKNCKQPPERILIPSNFSFILNTYQTEQIEFFIKAFLNFGVLLIFSCSIDGLLLETKNRSFKNEKQNFLKEQEGYYQKIFDFCKKYDFGFHPMVNANSISLWKEQYKWWIDNFIKNDIDLEKSCMFLEVRNNEWNYDNIISYLEYLNIVVDYTLKYYYKNNIELFLLKAFNLNKKVTYNYKNFGLTFLNQSMSCPVNRMIAIRLGDLTWIPCHRTCYEPFIYGKFNIKDNKIIKLEAKNLAIMFEIYGTGYKGHPKCDICAIGNICPRGCFGSQFEANKEFFYPCNTVCDLYIAKILFLFYKYQKIIKDNNITNKKILNHINHIYFNNINKIPQEDSFKWKTKIEQLIAN